MTVPERRMLEKTLKMAKELKEARAGVAELNLAVNAVLIGTALAYGARLPDGGMVLTMDRPGVVLNERYAVKPMWDRKGRLRVEVREKTE